jgi:hypothetical protein
MKRFVPLVIASITGFVLIVAWFLPAAEQWGDVAMAWFNILAAIAFVLGGGNLLKMHLQKISAQRPGWGYSVVTLAAFLVTLVVGLGKFGVRPDAPGRPWSGGYDQEGSAFWWIFSYVFSPLNATVFALLAFFVASAAFRAFRAKNTEATVLLATAFVVLLGRTYAGVFLTGWLPEQLSFLGFDRLTSFIMNVFNLAGMRAITIGIALGIVATSLRVLLGIDRSYLGSEE